MAIRAEPVLSLDTLSGGSKLISPTLVKVEPSLLIVIPSGGGGIVTSAVTSPLEAVVDLTVAPLNLRLPTPWIDVVSSSTPKLVSTTTSPLTLSTNTEAEGNTKLFALIGVPPTVCLIPNSDMSCLYSKVRSLAE